jgi:hypothetical protein
MAKDVIAVELILPYDTCQDSSRDKVFLSVWQAAPFWTPRTCLCNQFVTCR